MKASLEKLFPQETKVKFNKIEKELTVHPITLADDAWLIQEFGGKDGLEKVFTGGDIRSMLRMLYRLLSPEDNDFITEIDFSVRDEDGKETKIKSNVDKLQYLIDITQIKLIMEALMRARGLSLPEIEETVGGEEKKKKAKK